MNVRQRLSATVIIVVMLVGLHGRIVHSAELDCLIEPYVVVSVSAAVEAVVETMSVDRGDLVKAGQVLATLESRLEKAAVAAARGRALMEGAIKSNQARLEFSTRKLTRNEGLFKKQLIALSELDETETAELVARMGLLEAEENKRLAALELERATAALALRTIRSPITGVVVERLLSPGESTERSPILKLAQLDPLRVEVIAPVALLGTIVLGARAELVPEAPVNGVHSAHVTVVDRVLDAASGTFGVRLELPNPHYRLPAGLKCRVRFLGEYTRR
jgi:RND family efflux transporter MFP subunit